MNVTSPSYDISRKSGSNGAGSLVQAGSPQSATNLVIEALSEFGVGYAGGCNLCAADYVINAPSVTSYN